MPARTHKSETPVFQYQTRYKDHSNDTEKLHTEEFLSKVETKGRISFLFKKLIHPGFAAT